ncbi:MAG: hypothetical protein QOG27_1175 [Verrucomicrobiota bacterium]
MTGRSNSFSGFREVEGSAAKLNIGTEQEPISPRFPEWPADTARIDDANVSYHPVELHMSVTADNDVRPKISKKRQETILGR